MDISKKFYCGILGFGIFGTIVGILSPSGVMASEAGEKGNQIIVESNKVYGGKDQQSKLTFIIKESEGEERKLVMRRAWKNYNGEKGIDSKVIIFQEYPPETNGSSFMGWFYRPSAGKKNEAWLYIPLLKKIEQLPDANNRDETFQDSDIKPSDMMVRSVQLDDHQFLKEETISNKVYDVVESTPKEKDPAYPYSKVQSWISKDQHLKEKVDYYDYEGRLLKRQLISWKKVKNASVWEKVVTSNMIKHNVTTLNISDIKIDAGLEDSYFSQRTMKSQAKK
ncbi:MAG: outer membrane lipoprotein-sorting protein [Nitrospirae bacterium]|nr:outer membrane lipoprotein-sorting protein [Nitrospirota bacterium]MBI3595117.1 outer membrane lipoprotein-sorting protein [Nitrospirota bacterium]